MALYFVLKWLFFPVHGCLCERNKPPWFWFSSPLVLECSWPWSDASVCPPGPSDPLWDSEIHAACSDTTVVLNPYSVYEPLQVNYWNYGSGWNYSVTLFVSIYTFLRVNLTTVMLSMVFNCMIIQINSIATLGVIVHFYLFIYSYLGVSVHYNLSPLFSGLYQWINLFVLIV